MLVNRVLGLRASRCEQHSGKHGRIEELRIPKIPDVEQIVELMQRLANDCPERVLMKRFETMIPSVASGASTRLIASRNA